MAGDRWAGIVVSGAGVRLVELHVPDEGPLIVEGEHQLSLQDGDRAEALQAMYSRVANQLREHHITNVVVKASAVPPKGPATGALLDSAELRGVVIASAATVSHVVLARRASVSRTFGSRKADAYLADSDFWGREVPNLKNKASREAALLVLASVRPRGAKGMRQ